MSNRVGDSSIHAEQGLQLLLAQRRGIDLERCLLEHGAAAAQLANGAARIDGTAASKSATSYYSTFTEEEERKGWKGGEDEKRDVGRSLLPRSQTCSKKRIAGVREQRS